MNIFIFLWYLKIIEKMIRVKISVFVRVKVMILYLVFIVVDGVFVLLLVEI